MFREEEGKDLCGRCPHTSDGLDGLRRSCFYFGAGQETRMNHEVPVHRGGSDGEENHL